MSDDPLRSCRLSAISLTSQDADALARFYEGAFGFRQTEAGRLEGPAFEALFQLRGGAKRILLELGAERLELLEFDEAGAGYPEDASASNLIFQHFAIVVSGMDEAYRRLTGQRGWRPISRGGPVLLPASSGGVTAFKFRDPDGHPLEFLAFPSDRTPEFWRGRTAPGPCLGIDHSAISVSGTARSIAFYGALGFKRIGQSFNHGVEQAQLDGVDHPDVEVTALQAGSSLQAGPAPHLELLCYRANEDATISPHAINDVAATRLIFEAQDAFGTIAMTDPDGHRIVIKPA